MRQRWRKIVAGGECRTQDLVRFPLDRSRIRGDLPTIELTIGEVLAATFASPRDRAAIGFETSTVTTVEIQQVFRMACGVRPRGILAATAGNGRLHQFPAKNCHCLAD